MGTNEWQLMSHAVNYCRQLQLETYRSTNSRCAQYKMYNEKQSFGVTDHLINWQNSLKVSRVWTRRKERINHPSAIGNRNENVPNRLRFFSLHKIIKNIMWKLALNPTHFHTTPLWLADGRCTAVRWFWRQNRVSFSQFFSWSLALECCLWQTYCRV